MEEISLSFTSRLDSSSAMWKQLLFFVLSFAEMTTSLSLQEGEETECGANEYLDDFPISCPDDSCNQAIMNQGRCVLAPALQLHPKKTCRCISGYFRIDNMGPCVPFSQCPAMTCPQNEHLEVCPPTFCFQGAFCPNGPNGNLTCEQPKQCAASPKCQCDFNYRRDRLFGGCIPITECPAFECGGANEEYAACDQSDDSCEEYLWTSFGLVTSEVADSITAAECKPRCRCMSGFYRDAATGTCVAASSCEAL